MLAFMLLAAAACASEEDGKTDFKQTCRDGQAETEGYPVPCDADGHADGVCTFGGPDAVPIRVREGKTFKTVNSCEVVAEFTCVASESTTPASATMPDWAQGMEQRMRDTAPREKSGPKIVGPLQPVVAPPQPKPVAETGEASRREEECRDGQATDGSVRCDLDGSADGICTFDDGSGGKLRVPAGEGIQRHENDGSLHIFTCASAREPDGPRYHSPNWDDHRAEDMKNWSDAMKKSQAKIESMLRKQGKTPHLYTGFGPDDVARFRWENGPDGYGSGPDAEERRRNDPGQGARQKP